MVMVSNLEKVSDLFKVCYVDAFNASAGSPLPSLTNGPFLGISDVDAQAAILNSYPPTGQPAAILNSEASPSNFSIQNSDPSSAVSGSNHVTSSGEVYPTAEVHNNGSYTNNGSS
ncbi:uncharacterized protein LOC111703527 [Eurytemora carolleeae]|uniref:uncharacterized protein LOC111703527 n=1 Tax=Eurytemora carolleeae TaxID=1294199 RepID=UPI000C7654A8|nr:uncharacterized protein LOC111703527 [Eurytemora carolleeae]|eukprot:XP_023331258.1 uncharacterized protein LOC111703527 [Eurytemora affinis]